MCGIAGILTTQPGSADLERVLLQTQKELRHRGPDDAGLWIQPASIAAFSHNRLSILDLSSAGHQPMSTPDGALTITFNGEIFNFLELRASLERDGIQFQSHSDTEVILRLYEKHGRDCVKQLRGMYAFAIWDERDRSCFIARDPFGIKPLYFAQSAGTFIFASELRPLLSSGLVPRHIDSAALARYFLTGSMPEPHTAVDAIKLLEAGTTLIWKDGQVQQHRWWNFHFASGESSITREEAIRTTRAALVDSVEHHFVSDVPVGVFLSGGIDSTALLALAHASGRRNIQTFSIGVDDSSRDESRMARRTAEHFGTRHTEMRLDADKARELFREFLNAVDQPTIDGFNTFTVSALAREQGIKVVLSGLGGDEMFAGYPSFNKLPSLDRVSKALGPFKGIAGQALQMLSGHPPLVRLGSALCDGGTLPQLYDAFRGIFSSRHARVLARHLTGEEPPRVPDSSRDETPATPSPRDAVSVLEMSRYMRNQLLRDSDVMSMAHGLELRVPLLDVSLFHAVSSIPAQYRLEQGKQLLLAAVPEIPDWIRNRPKGGFLFPYEQWLASPDWRALFEKELGDIPVPLTNWYQRWSIFVFKRWRAAVGL
ncbi:asparagine synthase (glutamine-hydrolyzing) [Roseimicrobium sp. ORNL1]|uniref:asparagine synthase (glutamine-hydrolyzing) n=1 Tax=Roseimicrobium sp. ORNL1 TaxID=2711231 RepID=UPI0013E16C6D|nr:asparagine synthase (glutamine-hydrolyzing) [Roseimicrobium sp. ORNL1]QIF04490.1 asparagine synthase (glutamine-hydrolyzing) [Roseimicrobium sp. ORNL1]